MPDVWQLASIFTQFLVYLGVLVSSGLALIRIAFADETAGLRRRMVRQATVFSSLAIAATGIGIGLKGAVLTGDASGMTDPETLHLLWQSPIGTAAILQIAGLILVVAGLRIAGIGLVVATAGSALALWSFSRIGHVADTDSFWLEFLLVLHLAAAAFWIGILSPLRILAGRRESLSRAASLGDRFGRIAIVTVPVLIAAGIVMAWFLLGSLSALVTTGYGLTLVTKILAAAGLLTAAAVNKLRIVPALLRGDLAAAGGLRRSILLEWVAFSLILLATATLTTLQGAPANTEAMSLSSRFG